MSVEKAMGLEDRNETEVQQPNIEATADFLRQRRAFSPVALTALVVLACFYTLYLAQGFFAPVVLAIVFNFFLNPFVRALGKLWIPEAAGALIAVVAGTSILGSLIYKFSGPVSEWVERAPQIAGNISSELQKLKRPVEKVTRATEQVSKITQVAACDQSKKPPTVEVKRPGIFDGLFSKTRDAVLGLVVFVVMLYFCCRQAICSCAS